MQICACRQASPAAAADVGADVGAVRDARVPDGARQQRRQRHQRRPRPPDRPRADASLRFLLPVLAFPIPH